MDGISIVITTLNEEKNIGALLDSLIIQERPYEIIVVDSNSIDSTADIIRSYEKKIENIKLIEARSSRGGGRNIGVESARYDYVSFIDADATASPDWIKNIRKYKYKYDVIAGAIITSGNKWYRTERLKIYHNGIEVTHPSANLTYSRDFFLKMGGFDQSFITAEDIDLNIRAVESGARWAFCRECIVYNKARDTLLGFINQAYWNGYGRAQLSFKHKNIRAEYFSEIKNIINPIYFLRNLAGLSGYIYGRIKINGIQYSASE
ncbi:glycosyltransferase [Acidiplasma sp.]|uniref:glycosyltransferase n=1 Tax=Acidiplasma sp. TaxID=1872114 RepID=UPI002587B999|nr:glycosyltransferase [Acidiplasma sp.]